MFRYFATIAAACAVVLFENSVFAGNDNYSQWSYSMPIYLNTTSSGANVAGNVTNFPVLVRLNPRNFSGFSNVLAGGADIRFSDTVGAHLPYQIERWADNPGTNDSADIWVLLPQVNGNSSGQRFKMYWGNSGAVDSSRGTAVFDTGNGFVGVWHLSDTNKTTGYVDATINALNATGNNMAVTDTVTAVIGKGQQFNGSNKYLTVASGINLANKKLTVSAWANLASAGADGYMFSQGKGAADSGLHFGYHYGSGNDSCFTFRFYLDDLNESGKFKSTGSWHYVAGTYDTTSGDRYKRIYIDGSQNIQGASNNFAYTGTLYIGAYLGGGSNWNGSLTEARIEKTNRSADWITLCYQNQQANQTLVCVENYNQWAYSRNITINTSVSGAGITSNQAGFPMLVRLTSNNFDFSQAQDSGQDLRFAKSNGVQFPYQIEQWNTNTQTAIIWVKIDTVFGSNSTQYFTMYWGNPSAIGRSNGAAVFDTGTGFQGVWHMSQDPSGGANSILDATYNASNGSPQASMGSSNLVSGTAGNALNFNGSPQNLQVSSSSNYKISNQFTIQAWVKTTVASYSAWQHIWGDWGGTSSIEFPINTTGHIFLDVSSTGSNSDGLTGNTALPLNTWCFVAGTFNAGTFNVYYNNSADATTKTGSAITSVYNSSQTKTIGSRDDPIDYFTGSVDEVCISNVARSPDWLKLCYYTQQASQTTVDAEDYAQWTYSKNINMNTSVTGANITSDQYYFPVLVRLTSGNFNFSQAQDTGMDIRFAKSNGTHLYYQIERWDRANQLAEVWVRIDTVFGNNGTQYFTMYWGNSGASSRSNGQAVFDTAHGFVAVWHLNDVNKTTGYGDATYDQLSATGNNMAVTDTASAMIAKGQTFNGSNKYLSIPSGINLAGKSLTVSAWAKRSTTGVAQWILSQGKAATDSCVQLNFTAGDVFQLGLYNDDVQMPSANASTGWHYYAGRLNDVNANEAVFFDGLQGNSKTAAKLFGGSGEFDIGRLVATSNGNFYGCLNEVRVEDTLRPKNWILLCYQNQCANQTLLDYDDYSKWSYSKNITINTSSSGGGANTSASVAMFPYLVRLNSGNFDFSQAQSNGGDIRFSKWDGTHYQYQIERWDKTNKLAEVWVQVDTVFGGNSSQYFKMYWGNASAASNSNGPAVFDTGQGFLGVWHLNTSGTGKRPDATANNDSATYGPAFTQNGGAIAGCDTFINASSQYETVANGINVANNSFTVSAWEKLAVASPASNRYLLGQGGAANDSGLHFGYRYASSTTGQFTFAFYGDDINGSASTIGTGWHFLTGTFDTGSKNQILYVDGSQAGSQTLTHKYKGTGPLYIGQSPAVTPSYFDGNVDEVVVSRGVRSVDWVKLCYYNQQSSSSVSTLDTADEYRPLGIKQYKTGSTVDSIYVGTSTPALPNHWAIRFAASKGGGIKFLSADSASINQISSAAAAPTCLQLCTTASPATREQAPRSHCWTARQCLPACGNRPPYRRNRLWWTIRFWALARWECALARTPAPMSGLRLNFAWATMPAPITGTCSTAAPRKRVQAFCTWTRRRASLTSFWFRFQIGARPRR